MDIETHGIENWRPKCQLMTVEHIDDIVSPYLLTVVLTTSPTPSIPSTELVSSVLSSLPSSLSRCPLIITFDGFSVSDNAHGRLKRGQVPQTMADDYPQYISNVKALFGPCTQELFDDTMHTYISHNEHTGNNRKVCFLRQKYRQGFAFNVKSAVHHTETPFVLIMQHDWVFHGPEPPLQDLLNVMQLEEHVNYVTFVARQSIDYETSRGGVTPQYSAVFRAAREMRRCTSVLKDVLIACLHFFDRPHLCSTSLYRDIFARAVMKRGDFIEDTFGVALIQSVTAAKTEQAGIAAWRKVGTWMYYPDNGKTVAVRHTSGRTCLPREQQEERIRQYVLDGRERHNMNKNM